MHSLFPYQNIKETIPTLWDTTKFIEKNPQYLAQNNLMDWVSDDKGQTYNGCHFWSNFEIGSLAFWRSEAYRKYFEHLDKAGGFFYERWGDAPVHSIAAALFLPREKSISLKMLVIIMFHLPIAQLIKKSERQEIVIVI